MFQDNLVDCIFPGGMVHVAMLLIVFMSEPHTAES